MRYNAFPFYQLEETHEPISHMSTSSSHKNGFTETFSLPVYFESEKTQWLLWLIIFTWRGVNVFILLYKFYPRIFHTKIGQKWPSSSGKEDFTILLSLPLGDGLGPLNLVQWFWNLKSWKCENLTDRRQITDRSR